MNIWFSTTFLIVFICHGNPLLAMVDLQGKKALEQLEFHKQQLHKKISWVDDHIDKSLRNNSDIEKEIEPLGHLRKEYLLRLDLYNRISLGVESHFKGGDLKVFLSAYLIKISEIEFKNNSKENLWKATLHMGKTLESVPEKFEDPIDFLVSYIEFSSLLNPKSPKDFIAKRNYTNGSEFVSGQPLSREDIGKNLPTLPPPREIRVK